MCGGKFVSAIEEFDVRIFRSMFIRLAGVCACTCLTGITYYLSLQSIPASIAVVLLKRGKR